MRKNLISFAIAAAIACASAYLFGAPKVSSLAGVLIEEGYTPISLKRVGNHFYVSCKLNGRSTRLIVDTGAGGTVIASGTLKSLGAPLTERQGKVYGFLGLAAKISRLAKSRIFRLGLIRQAHIPWGPGISRIKFPLEVRTWMVS